MQSKLSQKNKNTRLFKRPMIGVAILIANAVVIFVFYGTAHAGLVSFMASLIGSDQASAKINQPTQTLNTQTMALLSAHSNVDPTADVAVNTTPVDGGETLVPDLAFSATSTDTNNTQISIYVVHSGDTISGVASMFKVSVNTILWANDLTGKSVLKPGQTLVILPISGINYTVSKGDTIKGIAAKYKADITDILNYNDITITTPLAVGQKLIIPAAEVALPSSIASGNKITKAPYEPILDNISALPSYPGYYINPLPSGTRTQGLHGHNAIDFAAPVGTPIKASAGGTVIIIRTNGGWNGGYGNYVVISHPNGTQTLYAHMSKSAVTSGSVVSQGQTIGYVGMTGLTTGPHVHFELRGARNPF